jgi:two-component system response regulator VanR
MSRILVIEDEPDIQELLENFLTDAGYEVTLAGDGVDGLTHFSKGAYDLVLLDIMLPKIDGYAVCELIRKESDVPILMLTALGTEEHQLKAYDLRADDYITKPFSMLIVLRKIAAVLRRSAVSDEQKRLVFQNLILDLDGYKTTVDGVPVELTQREFELLRELLMHPGKVLTRQALLNKLWQYDFFGDERVVDTHIKNLRKKINMDCIETIRGVGYRIDPPYQK